MLINIDRTCHNLWIRPEAAQLSVPTWMYLYFELTDWNHSLCKHMNSTFRVENKYLFSAGDCLHWPPCTGVQWHAASQSATDDCFLVFLAVDTGAQSVLDSSASSWQHRRFPPRWEPPRTKQQEEQRGIGLLLLIHKLHHWSPGSHQGGMSAHKACPSTGITHTHTANVFL